jgi:hypothetical protein
VLALGVADRLVPYTERPWEREAHFFSHSQIDEAVGTR